jgi:hypothetical protein
MTDGFLLGRRALQQIDKTVREVARRVRNSEPHRGHNSRGVERRWVVLDEDLPAATNSLTAPGTALAYFVNRKDDGDLEVSSESVTIVNRFKRLQFPAVDGELIGVEYMCGEWTIYKADCP